MPETVKDPRDIIRTAIRDMGKGGETYRRSFSRDSEIFRNLDWVAEDNRYGKSICGNASSWLEAFLPDFLEAQGLRCSVFRATSSVKNGCFHHFNMVKIEGAEPVICDLTASQYFTRPLTALHGRAYFVGTRNELRAIVETARQNTWDVVCQAFPEREFRSLWDVDFHFYGDRDFRKALNHLLNEETERSCLRTESFYYPMEITWGARRSHLLNGHIDGEVRRALTVEFERTGIADLTEDKDQEITDLITILSSRNFSLNDAPVLRPLSVRP